jgi:hypothetical protein
MTDPKATFLVIADKLDFDQQSKLISDNDSP